MFIYISTIRVAVYSIIQSATCMYLSSFASVNKIGCLMVISSIKQMAPFWLFRSIVCRDLNWPCSGSPGIFSKFSTRESYTHQPVQAYIRLARAYSPAQTKLNTRNFSSPSQSLSHSYSRSLS